MINTARSRAAGNEALLADYLPYSTHIDEKTISTNDGRYIRCFKFAGIPFETTSNEDISIYHSRFNAWLKNISEHNLSIWTHQIRLKGSDAIGGEFEQSFCKRFDDKYKTLFNEDCLKNEFYLTIVYDQSDIKINAVKSILNRIGSNYKNIDDVLMSRKKATKQLDKFSLSIMESFKDYNVTEMGCYENENGTFCSDILSLLNFLVTGKKKDIPVPDMLINSYIGDSIIRMGSDVIALSSTECKKYFKGLDIREYCNYSQYGMFNKFLFSDYEYIITQSFSLYGRKKALTRMNSHEKLLRNSGDDGISQLADFAVAKDQIINGDIALGEYHFSLMVIGDSVKEVDSHAAKAARTFESLDIMCSSVTLGTNAVFFSQLPANHKYRHRVVDLTTRNVASMSPFNNFIIGKKKGNPWGNAVTRFKSLAGHSHFFNFHSSPENKDNFGDKIAGNSYIIGKTGTGKTVLMALLLMQLQKFGKDNKQSTVFFDKDRGAEVLIRAIGGTYLRVKNGKPTGFNPFQMHPTKENLSFLKRLVCRLMEGYEPLTERQRGKIDRAVDAVMTSDKSLRRLSLVSQNISEEVGEGLKQKLNPWLVGGEFGWVFDNEKDGLNFDVSPVVGIDGTEFLDNSDTCSPISMYLLHKMEEISDGRRFSYFMDEAWKWIDDDVFQDFVGDKQVTIRKKNGFGVFATQMPSQFLRSKIVAELIQSTVTAIYLPNPNANKHEYVDMGDGKPNLGLTEKEFEIVKSFQDNSRLCLIKQGGKSSIVSFALPGMSEEITIMSTGDEDLPFLDQALLEVGEDPEKWMPVFLNKVKANKQSKLKVINNE
jgi:type IV secretion system protein VirB4